MSVVLVEMKRRADLSRLQLHARYQAIADTAPDAIVSIDENNRIQLVNPAAAKIFGWVEADLTGQPLTLLLPDFRVAERTTSVEWRGRRRDGTDFSAEASFREVDSGGRKQFTGFIRDVTDRNRAEEALRESELGFRLIVDSIPGLVSMQRASGEVELVNRQIRDYSGQTLEQLKDWRPIVHPDDLELTVEQWNRSIRTGEPLDIELRLRRADGMFRWFHARALPMRDSGGSIVRWYTLLSDIEDRKKAEESVRVSEYNLRMIVDSIPGLVHTMTPEGEIELISQQILDLSGKTLEELKDWDRLVHPGDRARVTSLVRGAIESGKAYDVELRILPADGVYRWFHSRGVPLRDAEGRIVRWYCLLTDVEDRKTAEEALRASERELSLIIETMPALVWSAAPDGALTYVNQRVLDYTGTTLAGLAKAGWLDFLHPDDVGPTVEAWSNAVATGRQHETQYRLRRYDGAYRWFHVLGQLGRDSDGHSTRWYGLLIDIDERKNTEEALRTTQARLSRASQIAAVGELAASIAHEVNQPLSAVVANGHACLRWLLAQPPNLVKAHEAAERIVRDGKDAGEVVRRVRALFSRASLERVPMDINDVIAEVLLLLGVETAKKGVVVETTLEEDLPPVVADRVQLQQLLLNLIVNGLDAMDPVLERPKVLSIRSRKHGADSVLVEIRDYGIGLTNPDRVFEAFFTTKGNGMGMGLAICRSIIEAHEGKLWASSDQVPGTTFSFTLPVKAKHGF